MVSIRLQGELVTTKESAAQAIAFGAIIYGGAMGVPQRA